MKTYSIIIICVIFVAWLVQQIVFYQINKRNKRRIKQLIKRNDWLIKQSKTLKQHKDAH